MKKIELGLNYKEIKGRIEADKKAYSVKEWSKMIGSSTATVSNIHGKSARVRPSLEYIVAVARVTGKPIEWYLYGKQPGNEASTRSEEEFIEEYIANWSEDDKKACRRFRKIMSSDNSGVKDALRWNLAAFEESLDQKEEIKRLNKRLQFLEERQKAERFTGTDEAASSSTGKPGM